MPVFTSLLCASLVLVLDATAADTPTPAPPAPRAPAATAPAPSVTSFRMNALDGTPVELSRYAGKVLLLVNTASQCGLTPQYEQLEGLHDRYAERGLAILGFPTNDFGGQEPGTNEEIGAFCKANYGVSFDMFSKIAVKGPDQAPLYALLTSHPEHGGEIRWNFDKFLVGRDGRVVARFSPKVKPDDATVVAAIEAELAKK